LEFYNTVTGSVYREVAAYKCAFTGAFSHADLPDNNVSGLNFLAAKYFNT
jgi:hypothetical protein